MGHLALYRKWRPQTFSALVGQGEIGRILKNAILRDRLVHAYLFCGTRGTGKTSTARILAKAVNCLDPQDGEPCNQCASCLRIMEGQALDIIEIDAASNRGIDEVRDLLEKVHFVPVESRYKVYIIDEAHMLTTEAFNALLKTFEEPPQHVLFILATTEARKVPLTIVSRCQRFDFKPIGEQEILENLTEIAAAEGISADPKALALLAQKAKGSMRDALSLLDQMMAEGDVEEKAVIDLLGGVERSFWPPFLQGVAEKDAAAVFSAIDDLEREGKDVRVFFQEMQTLLGDLLIFSSGGRRFSTAYREFLAANDGILSSEEILAIIATIGEGEMAFRYQRDSKMVLQFLFAKILRGDGEKAEAPIAAKTNDKKQGVAPKERTVAAAEGSKPQSPPVKPQVNEVKPADKAKEIAIIWQQLMKEIKIESPKTSTWLMPARIAAVEEDRVVIAYGPDGEMHRDKISGPAHMEALTKVLSEILGRDVEVKIEGVQKKAENHGENSLFDIS